MIAVFAIIFGALILFALEKVPMEITAIGVVCVLLTFFSFFPIVDADGANRLPPARILHGFANPALITVLALMVMGQGMLRTGAIDWAARTVLKMGGGSGAVSVGLVLLVALVVSGFLNNTPVVIIFIPVMQVLAARFGRSVSKLMIPLSFAAVLGGMTTLLGSSTNLLVNGALLEMGEEPFSFFDFTVPGVILALVGFFYVYLIAPKLLPDRASFVDRLVDRGGRQFIAQLTLSPDSRLAGKGARGGIFPDLPDMTVRLVQRGETAILPPFEDLVLRSGDVLVVAATRAALTTAMAEDPGLLNPRFKEAGNAREGDDAAPGVKASVLAEAMVTPASNFIGQTLPRIGFRHKTRCIVLGIQRRSRMIRSRVTDIRLRAGDVLLVRGQSQDIDALKKNKDVLLIEWSAEELPVLTHARRALIIFAGAMTLAAADIVPIVVAALSGAVAMVGLGVLNVRQAARSVDPKIVTAIGAALAMGVALQESGGAAFLAHLVVDAVGGFSLPVVLAILFLLVACFTNIISNNACAVLFTPIAVDMAMEMGVAPEPFAVAVIFAANCSFATPFGYQTNLLVMGPGHYRFLDFARAGVPLILLLWGAFSLVIPWYYGL
ncbi:MAG: SLC13 family permease [Rhodospirillales bacterium]|nr:SLC13 family permease [Rhodospirillales bacterium]